MEDWNKDGRKRSRSRDRGNGSTTAGSTTQSSGNGKKVIDVPQIRRQMDQKELQRWEIYSGNVTKILEHGIYISFRHKEQREEGLVHISEITTDTNQSQRPEDLVRRKQEVFVKVLNWINITTGSGGKKLSLTMAECDQITGKDLNPRSVE